MPSLSITARREYYTELGNSLPLPVLDKLEYRERRLITAGEAFDALRPGNSYEASLAVRIVLCGAHAVECLREADLYREDYAKRTRCRAQAANMMRAGDSAKRTLEREQKLRLAGEAVTGGVPEQPAEAVALPPHAEPQAPLSDQGAAAAPPPVRVPAAVPPATPEPPAVAPRRVQAEAASPPPALVPSTVMLPRPAVANAGPPALPAGSVPPPSREATAGAEAFAAAHGMAAALIRQDCGVAPQNRVDFPEATLPTGPVATDAPVHGGSDLLTPRGEAGCETPDKAGCAELDEAA